MRDTTLIGTKEAAKILKRKEAWTRRLLADGKSFKTAVQPARDWLVERWEVVQYAETHPKQTHKSN